MNFLKTLNKILEGIFWLYLPVVLFYWALLPVNLPVLIPLKALLGTLAQPPISFLDTYFTFEVAYGKTKISYTPLILGGIAVLIAFAFSLNYRVFELIEKSIYKTKLKMMEKKFEEKKEEEKLAQIEELNKNKYIYSKIKINKQQQHESYLFKDEDDPFSVGVLDSYQTSIVSLAEKFSGKRYEDPQCAEQNVHCFIFADIEKFIQYLKFMQGKIKEINKGTADLNTVFTCEVACNCGYSVANLEEELFIADKILNLCGKEEILITNLLKDKLENLELCSELSLEPKGLYLIDKKSIDIFELRFV